MGVALSRCVVADADEQEQELRRLHELLHFQENFLAVIAHELYIVLFSNYPIADPFLHVMTEMVVLVPGSAMVFIAVATFRNRLLFIRSE